MSKGQEDISSQPLVIVRRRRGNGDDEHHGGAWKIAYADFMTALMAFFLVMWLVNAADRQTIIQVAAYFNPIRLTDRHATVQGLEDIDETIKSKPGQKGKTKKAANEELLDAPESTKSPPPNSSAAGTDIAGEPGSLAAEAELFANPAYELNKLASKAMERSTQFSGQEIDAATVRDPFDQTQVVQVKPQVPNVDAAIEKMTEPEKSQMTGLQKNSVEQVVDKEDWKKVELEIRSQLRELVTALPDVEVRTTPEGLLISVIDNDKFTMFSVGSAQPQPELVVVMQRIANVLKSRPGNIILRGHTDGRQYRNSHYDNWRLSTARAHMAYYMMLRGGVGDRRVIAVEGRADRDLKDAINQNAAKNRRIEILVKEAQP